MSELGWISIKSYNKVTIIQNFLNFMLGNANNNKHFHRTEETRPD